MHDCTRVTLPVSSNHEREATTKVKSRLLRASTCSAQPMETITQSYHGCRCKATATASNLKSLLWKLCFVLTIGEKPFQSGLLRCVMCYHLHKHAEFTVWGNSSSLRRSCICIDLNMQWHRTRLAQPVRLLRQLSISVNLCSSPTRRISKWGHFVLYYKWIKMIYYE